MHSVDILILGAGFSGLMTAYHLASSSPSLKVAILSLDNKIGGAAYSNAPEHAVLNVPHWNMSAFVDRLDDFSNFVAQNNLQLLDDAFARRSDYQRYLLDIKRQLVEKGVCFFNDTANSLSKHNDRWLIESSRQKVLAQSIVLALGNMSPNPITDLLAIPNESVPLPVANIIDDPWSLSDLDDLSNSKAICLLDTGLTCLDFIWELYLRNYKGEIVLLSRRGLLPMSHDLRIKADACHGFLANLRSAVKHIRSSAKSSDIRAVVDGIRPQTQRMWQNFNLKEKKRFLSKFRPYWDVIRHRAAPSLLNALKDLKQQHKLRIVRGKINDISVQESLNPNQPTARTKRLSISINESNKGIRNIIVDYLINCTGPRNISANSSPLINSIITQKHALLDELSLGLATDSAGRIYDPTNVHNKLYAIGPIRKGMSWENTAIPELRLESYNLAKTIIEDLEWQ